MNILSDAKQHDVSALFAAGLTIRAVAKAAGVNKATAHRYSIILPPHLCPCGKISTHRGWCSHRVALSPNRQIFLRRFSPIKIETITRWKNDAAAIYDAIKFKKEIAPIDGDAMASLKRFYDNPDRLVGFQSSGKIDGKSEIIAAVTASQENFWPTLDKKIKTLPAKLSAIVHMILDDRSLDETAKILSLTSDEMANARKELATILGPALGVT